MEERTEYKWRKRVREEKIVKFPILLYVAAYLCFGFKIKYPDSWQVHQPFIEMLMHGKEINTSIYKWFLVIMLIVFWGSLLGSLFIGFLGKIDTEVLNVVAFLTGMFLGMDVQKYIYILDSRNIHFLKISMIISSIIVGIYITLMIVGKIKYRGVMVSPDLLKVIIVWVVVVFSLTVTLNHLNNVLDKSEPQIYSASIEGKQQQYVGKYKSGRYGWNKKYIGIIRFRFDDGLKIVHVSDYYYDKYQKDDIITVYQYEGFWGNPYYVIEADVE